MMGRDTSAAEPEGDSQGGFSGVLANAWQLAESLWYSFTGTSPATASQPSSVTAGDAQAAEAGPAPPAPFVSTTRGLWNRCRDREVVKRHLKLREQGDDTTAFFDLSGLALATGYSRLLFGDHGPYVEFETRHLVVGNLRAGPAKSEAAQFYRDHFTASPTPAMLYEQLRSVATQPNPPRTGNWWASNNRPEGYADYRPGMWYCGCDQLQVMRSSGDGGAGDGHEAGGEGAAKLARIPAKQHGRVVQYVAKRGFGHIAWAPTPGEEEHIFVTRSGILGSAEDQVLCAGERVEFRVMRTFKGKPMATDVTGPGGGALRKAALRTSAPAAAPDLPPAAPTPRDAASRIAKRLARQLRDGYTKRLRLERSALPAWLHSIQRGSVACVVLPTAEPRPEDLPAGAVAEAAVRACVDLLTTGGWANASGPAGGAAADGEPCPGPAQPGRTFRVVWADRKAGRGRGSGEVDTRELIGLRREAGVERVVLRAESPDAAVRAALTLCGTSTSTAGTDPFVPLSIRGTGGAPVEERCVVMVLERDGGSAVAALGRAAGREYCWRCGDTEHLKGECPRC